MGKRSKKSGSGQGASIDRKAGDEVPSFDENALSALTSRIEKGFGDKSNRSGGSKSTPQKNGKNSNPSITTTDQSSNSKSKSKSKPKPSGLVKGVKRDANGSAKPQSSYQKSGSHKTTSQKPTNGKTDRQVLLAEILALGGTEEDLDLVVDAASDEDEEGQKNATAPPNKSFRAELAKFVEGLGIEGVVGEDESEEEGRQLETPDDDDDNDDANEWEEDSNIPSSAASAASGNEEPASLKTLEKISKNAKSSEDPHRLIFSARPDWHAAPLPDLPVLDVDESTRYLNAISSLKEYAQTLLEADSSLYTSKHLSSSSSHKFLSTIMSSGTLSDKVSALTLVVQESPVHTAQSFESLLTLAKKRSRGQAVAALSALKDLLGVGVVLPSDRRLRTFATQPGLIATLQEESVFGWKSGSPLPGNITKAHLISWAYEDWLKDSYFDMLKVLEVWCSDEVEFARSRAVTYVYELLKEKPEQEANLLRLLVNKLGDPDKKISSRTSYLLLQLQISHPAMKEVIIRSIETELLLRPGQSLHAKYYAINTLNQTILSAKEENVAQRLLDIYFQLFVALLKKPDPQKAIDAPVVNRKGQVQGGGGPMGKKAKAKAAKEAESKLATEETTEKMISAVLTGVNRAFPFSKTDDSTLESHMDTLFRITHSSNFNTSIQALMLIEQLANSKHLAVDRFYRTLYESLLDPRLMNSSKHALYLNLLFRALRSDVNIKRVKAFAKRLLQIITLHQPPFICGVLYLLRELEASFPGLRSLYNDPENYEGIDEEVFRDVPEDGELSITPVQDHRQPAHVDIYDGRKRDPEHSNADKTCLWETIPFLVHFHPSVSLFADRLISDIKMPPKPDLASHGLASFLDRFVYRNAKLSGSGPRGGSIMQPLSGGDSRGVLIASKAVANGQGPLNTEAFWRQKAEDVAVDEVFFHKYFNQVGKSKQSSKKSAAPKADADADGEDDENEDEIWQALVDSRPEVEGPSDDDSDLDMLDLEDSDDGLDSENGGVEFNDEDQQDEDEDEEESDAEVVDFGGDSDELDSGSDDGEDGEDLDELFKKELQSAQAEEADDPKKSETSRQKKRRLKSLPTFASAEDYAAMLDNDDDEDV